MKKRIPTLQSDEEAEAFVEEADLSTYDLSGRGPCSLSLPGKWPASICGYLLRLENIGTSA